MEDGKHNQCIAARKLKKATNLCEELRVEDDSFSRGEDDEDIPDHVSNHGPAEPSQTPNTPIHGSISRSHANKQ
jgi:hypothetical protein